MVQSKPNFVTATLPSGNVLVCDNSNLPQDLFLVNSADVEKAVTNFSSRELKPEAILKHVIYLQFTRISFYSFLFLIKRVSLTPDLDFRVERFVISQDFICAADKHCLSLLQPLSESQSVGDTDCSIFK